MEATEPRESLLGRVGSDLRQTEQSVWVFYAVALLSLGFEGSLVEFLGPIEFALIYLAIGGGFATYHLVATETAQKPLGPILGPCLRVRQRFPTVGFLLTVFIGGAPGVAIVWTKLHRHDRVRMTVLATGLFVLIWAPLWYGLFSWLGISDAFNYDLADLIGGAFG